MQYGDKARVRFHHLLLDSLTKDWEKDTKSGLAATGWKRKLATNNSGKEAEWSTRPPMAAPLETIRVVVVEREKQLVGQTRNLWCVEAHVKQLVPLRNRTVAEAVSGIDSRILNSQYIRAMYGVITKLPQKGGVPRDMEKITSYADLANFIEIASGAYKPIMVYVQRFTPRGKGQQTPPPDDQP